MTVHIFDEPKIDCHMHVLDPARFLAILYWRASSSVPAKRKPAKKKKRKESIRDAA